MFGVLFALSLAQSALAQNTGLLLGIDGENATRTLWITRESDGRVALAGELRRLLVPRSDGFWWVDVDRQCSTHDGDPDDPDNPLFIDKEGFVVRAKVDGEPLNPNLNHNNCDAIGRQILKRDEIPRPHGRPRGSVLHLQHDRADARIRPRHLLPPAFVVDRVLQSREIHVLGALPRRGFRSSRECSLLDALTPAAADVSARDVGAPERRLRAGRFARRQLGDRADQGEWRATFATAGDIARKGQSGGEFTVTVRVPSSIVKQDSFEPWAAELRRRMPGGVIDTVFVSPRRDWLIASSGAATPGVHAVRERARRSSSHPATARVRARRDG